MASAISRVSPHVQPGAHMAPPIASDAEYRVKVLKETGLLDSSTMESDFDRYTALAKRIFKAPIGLISLVDSSRQWFKSKFGLKVKETDIQYAFCAYTVLPESPDVFVVLNALTDPRFANNPLVTGPPHIRFYAGAALIVAGTKVGSLCVIDTQPRSSLSLDDRMNLLDMGEAVSTLIRDRRKIVLNADKERVALMLEKIHKIHSTIDTISSSIEYFSSGEERQTITSKLGADNDFSVHFDKLVDALRRMNVVVNAADHLGKAVLSSVGDEGKAADSYDPYEQLQRREGRDCNMLKYLQGVRTILSKAAAADRISWVVETQDLGLGSHSSFPNEAMFVLLTIVDQLSYLFNRIVIHVEFRKHVAVSEFDCALCDDGLVEGRFFVSIAATNKDDAPAFSSTISAIDDKAQQQHLFHGLDLTSVDRVLGDIGGGVRHSSLGDGKGGGIIVEFWVWCEIDKMKPLSESGPEEGEGAAGGRRIAAEDEVRGGEEAVQAVPSSPFTESTANDQFVSME